MIHWPPIFRRRQDYFPRQSGVQDHARFPLLHAIQSRRRLLQNISVF